MAIDGPGDLRHELVGPGRLRDPAGQDDQHEGLAPGRLDDRGVVIDPGERARLVRDRDARRQPVNEQVTLAHKPV